LSFAAADLKTLPVWEQFNTSDIEAVLIVDSTLHPIARPSDMRLQAATFNDHRKKNAISSTLVIDMQGHLLALHTGMMGAISDVEAFESISELRYQQLHQQRLAVDPHAPPFIIADRGYRQMDPAIVRVPRNLAERAAASPEQNAQASDFCSMRMRVEGAIARIKTWQVTSAKFRSPNHVFHCDCIVAAAMIAEFIHDRHNH
jgi:hypothetical protein